MDRKSRLMAFVVWAAALCACGGQSQDPHVVRVGHFPNVTHAQALVAHGMTREGKGWFEERLGPGMKVEWYAFNAGPSAMEAMLAGTLDLAYVGPSPAINAHVKSGGEDVRVVAGSARGGAALVVQGDGRIKAPGDFRGRSIATPQLGNTQDVACRAWLAAQGFKVTQTGGDVSVMSGTQNPDQLSLFVKGDLDAVWTVEPWVSRLEMEGRGKLFLEETDAVTTVLVASARFLRERPDVARQFVEAHAEVTAWLVAHPEDAQRKVRAELAEETRQQMAPELLAHCWPRLVFDAAVPAGAFENFVAAAREAGFLKDASDISRLVEAPK